MNLTTENRTPTPRLKIGSRLALFGLTAAILTAAPPTSCTPDPVVVTIYDSYADPDTSTVYTSAIQSDGAGPYVNGEAGVGAIIASCPNGAGDAILNFSGTKKNPARNFRLDLGNVVASGSTTPSWATGTLPITIQLTIGKILHNYSPNQTYSFTTGIGAAGFPNPNYYLRIENPLRDTAAGGIPNANLPCDTAKVIVQHVPATVSAKESWYVWPDSTAYGTNTGCGNDPMSTPIQVGAIVDSRRSWTSVGQFQIPFYIKIQRK